MLWIYVIAVVCYLIGSIPFGLLIGKLKGIDIREHGSKNIGATNAVRVLGKGLGYTVFALDVLKGLVSVWFSQFFAGGSGDETEAGILAAVACILGHNFPIWLKFRGGKGIATSAGVLIGLMPIAVLTISTVWVIVFFATGYVSLASISASACLPVTVFALTMTGFIKGWSLFIFAVVIAALAIWRHRANIQRLMAGTESRFKKNEEPRPKTKPKRPAARAMGGR